MSDELTKKQKEELQRLVDEIMNLSTKVVEDYEEMPTELSGSITQINENSPFLDGIFKDESWKKVIKNIPPIPDNIEEDKDASE